VTAAHAYIYAAAFFPRLSAACTLQQPCCFAFDRGFAACRIFCAPPVISCAIWNSAYRHTATVNSNTMLPRCCHRRCATTLPSCRVPDFTTATVALTIPAFVATTLLCHHCLRQRAGDVRFATGWCLPQRAAVGGHTCLDRATRLAFSAASRYLRLLPLLP